MKIYKMLFLINLFSGLIIFLIGVYLNYVNKYSKGNIAGRFGEIHYGMINGDIGMFLGVIILLLSIYTFNMYRDEKKKFDKME